MATDEPIDHAQTSFLGTGWSFPPSFTRGTSRFSPKWTASRQKLMLRHRDCLPCLSAPIQGSELREHRMSVRRCGQGGLDSPLR